MFRFCYIAVFLLWVGLSAGRVSGETNLVTGILTTNTTLSGTNLLSGTVVVTNGVVLTLEPGTRMLMNNNATLLIYGQLLALGTSNAPIFFTRATLSARWGRILFLQALDSRFEHCVVEYSNCIGDHKAYYDNDCNPTTAPPSRNYFQAVVALGCHLDFESCTFQNLPDEAIPANRGTEKGDAIAIISDDPDRPGVASATIRRCQFIPPIGQGIHTRYSYVLVENCFFRGHYGDNDDVDLYGESIPPPLIRSNVFILAHDDFINPTRCSAIIVNNVFVGDTASGGTDHGVVLRDSGSPIVANNLIYNCPSGGISVQNQNNAQLINNTIVNCGIGVRFIFHSDRLPPNTYCLAAGRARAMIINCVLWDCPTSIAMNETDDPGSQATIIHSNLEGGQANISVAGNSSFTWGAGNLNVNPGFANLGTNNFHLTNGSSCIDAGTNITVVISITNLAGVITNISFTVTNDHDGLPRPLDGNGDSLAQFDMGAYEFLLPTADTNGDGIPDEWTWRYGLDPTDPNVAASNPDSDPHTTLQEWIAATDPTNPLSYFQLNGLSAGPPVTVQFLSASNRLYTLSCATHLGSMGPDTSWSEVPGQVEVLGTGSLHTLSDTNVPSAQKFYRVQVKTP